LKDIPHPRTKKLEGQRIFPLTVSRDRRRTVTASANYRCDCGSKVNFRFGTRCARKRDGGGSLIPSLVSNGCQPAYFRMATLSKIKRLEKALLRCQTEMEKFAGYCDPPAPRKTPSYGYAQVEIAKIALADEVLRLVGINPSSPKGGRK
jgi:hypothetical protein